MLVSWSKLGLKWLGVLIVPRALRKTYSMANIEIHAIDSVTLSVSSVRRLIVDENGKLDNY